MAAVALVLGASCRDEPRTGVQPAPATLPVESVLGLATEAGLADVSATSAPCSGGGAGVQVEARGGFASHTSFLQKAGAQAREETLELEASAAGLRLRARLCPLDGAGAGRAAALLVALSHAIPERTVVTGVAVRGGRARLEGSGADAASASELAAALRGRPGLGEVGVKAVGLDGERHAFVLEVELATR